MFLSSRVPADLRPNALSVLLSQLRRGRASLTDLTESNPTRVGLEYDPDLLTALASPENLTYVPEPFGLPIAREAVSRDFARRGLEVPPSRVVLTASTSEAYSLLFKLLCDPGDRVLVPAPSYPLFDHLTRLDAVEAVPYALEFNGRWSVDVAAVRGAITSRTRAVLVVNPNNPTGSFVSAADLAELRALCRTHRLALVGDEVFADYHVDPAKATSVLERDEVLAFGLGGLSKSAGLPQLKLGWIGLTGPRSAVARALDGLELICDAYLSVATPVQRAAPVLLEAAPCVRTQIRARVRENLDALTAAAARHPSIEILPCEGGWYAVARVPRLRSEEDLVVSLLTEHHIVVHPGYFFDFPHEAFLVLSLLPRVEVFRRASETVLSVAAGGLRR